MLVDSNKTHEYNFIFLSPHYDDAVWSAGGIIYSTAHQDKEKVCVVTVFNTGIHLRESRLSRLGETMLKKWGFRNLQDYIIQRMTEDDAALHELRVDGTSLHMTEALFDVDNMHFWRPEQLHQALAKHDHLKIKELARWIDHVYNLNPLVYFFGPQAIGDHIDHQIVKRALSYSSVPKDHIWLWEDFPYDQWFPGTEDEFANRLQCPIDIEIKIAAGLKYRTQVKDLFGTDDAFCEAMKKKNLHWHRYSESFRAPGVEGA